MNGPTRDSHLRRHHFNLEPQTDPNIIHQTYTHTPSQLIIHDETGAPDKK